MEEAKRGVEDDNGDEFWCLQQIEVPRLKKERVDGGKLNLAYSN